MAQIPQTSEITFLNYTVMIKDSMTKDELLEQAIYWFKIIDEDLRRLTTGNLPHNAATTKGRAKRAFEFLEKHKNDESKQEWSKEDEVMIELIADSLKCLLEEHRNSIADSQIQKEISWLKSLKSKIQ